MKQQQRKILNSGLQGAAVMGKTYTLIGTIISVIIGILLILWINGKRKYSKLVEGKIEKVSCSKVADYFECKVELMYNYSNKSYPKSINNYISSKELIIGDTISLYINPQKPKVAKLQKTPCWFSILVFIIGILMIFFSILYMFFIFNYKGLAVISGLKTVIRE
jgi:hypothetical protein